MVKEFFAAIVLVFASVLGFHHAQPAPVAPIAIVKSSSVHSLSVPSLSVAAIDLAPTKSAPTVVPAAIRSPAPATPEGGLVLGAAIAVPDTVTHAELNAALDQLGNSLRSQFFSVTSSGPSFSGAPASTPVSFQTFATSQKIDQLSNVTITNATVHGVSGLTAADIPTGITAANYLPLAGGTLTGTLSGTNLTLSGNLTVAGAQTLSGAITIPYLTATSTTANSTFAGAVGIGTTSPVSQLDLENYTVTSDGGTLTGGNPQLQINGTLDTTQGAVGHVIGAQWQWNTVGSNGVNVNGLRINLQPGYTGNGLVRGADINNLVQGTHSLGIADEHGNIGATLAAQGGATDDSTIGDNVGAYAIANGSKNVNVAVYGRSFDQAPTGAGYSVANIGVIGVAQHNYLGPASTEIGGFFAAGGGGNWYSQLATTSTALLLDNEAENVPLVIGRVNGVNAFTVTSTGGIISTSTTNATNFWQVLNSSGSSVLDIDTANQRVGIGTTSPADNLVVTNPSTTASFSIRSAGANVGSGNVRFAMQNGDGNTYQWQYSGTGNTILKLQYNAATHDVFGSNGSLALGYAGGAANLLDVVGGGASIGSGGASPYGTAPTGGLIVQGNVGVGTTNPYSRLQVTGPDTASSSAFAVVNSASTTVFSVYDNGNATYSGSMFQSSDARLKTNVEGLDASSSLAAIEALNPVSYTRLDQPGQGENLGFLAQAVQAVFPALVSTTSATALTPDGTLTLNYVGLISPIVSAIQALDSEITVLASTVSGFAQNFATQTLVADNGTFQQVTSQQDTTQKLCIADAEGAKTCVTKSEFDALLEKQGVSPLPSAPAATPSSPTTQTASSSAEAATSTASTTTDAPSIVPDYNATTTLPSAPAVVATSSVLSPTVEEATSSAAAAAASSSAQ